MQHLTRSQESRHYSLHSSYSQPPNSPVNYNEQYIEHSSNNGRAYFILFFLIIFTIILVYLTIKGYTRIIFDKISNSLKNMYSASPETTVKDGLDFEQRQYMHNASNNKKSITQIKKIMNNASNKSTF